MQGSYERMSNPSTKNWEVYELHCLIASFCVTFGIQTYHYNVSFSVGIICCPEKWPWVLGFDWTHCMRKWSVEKKSYFLLPSKASAWWLQREGTYSGTLCNTLIHYVPSCSKPQSVLIQNGVCSLSRLGLNSPQTWLSRWTISQTDWDMWAENLRTIILKNYCCLISLSHFPFNRLFSGIFRSWSSGTSWF